MFFSRRTPDLATVIPATDHIDDVLDGFSRNTDYNMAIRSAVDLTKRTLNR